MDKSQSRTSGTPPPRVGHQFKLIAALTLAVIASGYFLLEASGHWSVDAGEQVTRSDCSDSANSADNYDDDCGPFLASQSSGQSSDLVVAEMPPAVQPYASDRRRDARAVLAEFPDLRPGYTLAELCAAGHGGTGYACRQGIDAGDFKVTDSPGGKLAARSISGRVHTSDGVGLDGVFIIATAERLQGTRSKTNSETLRFRTVTNVRGEYSLDGLPEGEYTLRSSAQGPFQSARISARTGVSYADVVVARKATTMLAGQVLTENGAPLEGVTVLPVLLGQPSVLTGDDGRFRLPVALKPGIRSLTLRFQRPGYVEVSSEIASPDPKTASDAAVNVVLQPVESWTALNGAVSDRSGDPLAGLAVELRPKNSRQSFNATTDNNGQFVFPIIESPAEYRLIVLGGVSYQDYQQALQLTAHTGDVEIVLEPYEFGTVTGQLVNQDGVPVPEFELLLRNTLSSRPNALVRSDTYGNFKIVAAPAGKFVLASRSDPALLVRGLQLEPGDNLHLPIVLDWGQHELRGSIVDSQGMPVPASRIILQWSGQADGMTARATRRTSADAQGQFAFSNLGPGPHSLQIDALGFFPVDIEHDIRRQGYELMVKLNRKVSEFAAYNQ